jgi:uncharacterized protein
MTNVLVVICMIMCSCNYRHTSTGKYPIQEVPFTSVNITDDFWAPKMEVNHKVTIPIAFGYCESSGRIKNFEIAGGLDTGAFQSIAPFDDSDVYKIIEGASYSLERFPDADLERYLDTLIWKIGKAQEADGYLYTNRTIAESRGETPHVWAGNERWLLTNIMSCELYNLGHLYEAAAAHFKSTGKRDLLDIALKSADLVNSVFGRDALVSYPGHQGIEMGLVKLYEVTGEVKYLDLARFFLDARGTRTDGEEYTQSHIPVVEQVTAGGHAVRAVYMYAGMSDIAALYNEKTYLKALNSIWDDLTGTKTYVTGGIGSTGGNEGFAEPYHLPNMSAYCETCASIGNIFFNHRMFLTYGDSRYYDVIEKTLYNSMLSGVSVSGDRFFYPNPLESNGQHQRSPWFGCACCPSNVARFMPAVPGYVFAGTQDRLYINLFVECEAEIELGGGREVRLSQETDFPWDGRIKFTMTDPADGRFELRMRVPGWAGNEALPGGLYRFADRNDDEVSVMVNGRSTDFRYDKGYAVLKRRWRKGDIIELNLPMNVRRVMADARVTADRHKMALQRGPLVYCAEWPDNSDGKVLNLLFDSLGQAEYSYRNDGGIESGVITTMANPVRRTLDGPLQVDDKVGVILIPYHLWSNRGPGQMMVWLPVAEDAVSPLPAPTIAARSEIAASVSTRALNALNDQYEPASSDDHSWPFYHWWPNTNRWEWVQYRFDKNETVSEVSVYWFDDGPAGGCRMPEAWIVDYEKDGKWVPVNNLSGYLVIKDGWNTMKFSPVNTRSLRLNVKLPVDFSSGIHEWIVK